jgi:uridine phosphorylase
MRARSEGSTLPSWRAAVIVFHSRARSRPIVERLGGSPITRNVFSAMEPSEVLSTTCAGEPVGILCCVGRKMGGGPLAAALVEELASIGVGLIVGLGCAGSIDPALRRGSQFVISAALATDGTSRNYLGEAAAAMPDGAMLAAVAATQDRRGRPIAPLTAATVDAIYRETPEAVADWRRAGAQIVNMEATPFYAAARVCGVRALYVGHVSDELHGLEWKDWFGADRDAMAWESAEIAAAVLERALAAG